MTITKKDKKRVSELVDRSIEKMHIENRIKRLTEENLQKEIHSCFDDVREEIRVKESLAYLQGISDTIDSAVDYLGKRNDPYLISFKLQQELYFENQVMIESLKLSNPEYKITFDDYKNIRKYM
jgi:hypothetical protein